MMKFLSLLISFILIANPVFAQIAPEKIQKDALQIGKAASLLPKELIFDAGEGASNKKLSLDPSDNEFDLNSKLNIAGGVSATGNASVGGTATVTGATTLGASLAVETTSTLKGNVTIGSGTNASKQINIDRAGFDPFMKWNETTQKWVYSNDGSVEKNIGSGSGGEGGVNILQNPSIEDGIAVDFTSSGGTFSAQTYATPDPSGNDSVYARFVATTVGQYFETVAHATPSYLVGGCLAKINYNTTDSANWKLQVYDNSSNLLKEENLYVKNWQNGYASFPCPTVGTLIKLRVISLAAGQIESDKFHLGSENRTAQIYNNISDPKTFTPTITTGSGSITNYTATAQWSRNGGKMLVEGNITFSAASAAFTSIFVAMPSGYLIDSANLKTPRNLGDTNAVDFGTMLYQDGTVEMFSTSTVIILAPMVDVHTGVSPVKGYAFSNIFPFTYGAGDAIEFSFEVPIAGWSASTNTALVPEAQDWFIDANIGGGNPGLGTITLSSYTEIVEASLDLVLNTGTASAKIPCTGSNPATGLTCTGGTTTESIGVNFTNPTVGFYKACIEFSHATQVSAGGNIDDTFQLVEVTPSTNTIVQEGKSRISNLWSPTGGGNRHSGMNVCGSFYFSSVAERTIKLMYEQGTIATVNNNILLGDRGAGQGQRDFHITVHPMLSAYNKPYLVNNSGYFEGRGNTRQVVSAGTNIPFTQTSLIGPGTWSGSSFTPNSSGIYKIEGSILFTAFLAANNIVLTKNGTQIKSIGSTTATSDDFMFNGTIELLATDVLSVQSSIGGTLNNGPVYHWISITKLQQ